MFTAKRIGNLLRCYGSYGLSLLGMVRVRHLPVFVSVEPAGVCQLRCPECPVGNGQRRRETAGKESAPRLMSRDLYRKVLAEVAETAQTIQFYFQGEPLLHPDLPEMIGEAHAKGLYTIVSTNAQALDRETARRLVASGLDRIIVSMDGLTQETYEAYRQGGSVEKAKEAMRYLHEEKERQKRGIVVELQCLRLRTNEAEWQRLRETYKALGADRLTFKTAQLYDYADGNDLMPTDLRYARYTKGRDGKYHLKRSWLRRTWESVAGVSPCYRLWAGCVVRTTGEVLPCCYDKSHAHGYGNLRDSTLRELFGSARARAFRERVVKMKGEVPEMCRNCWH